MATNKICYYELKKQTNLTFASVGKGNQVPQCKQLKQLCTTY